MWVSDIAGVYDHVKTVKILGVTAESFTNQRNLIIWIIDYVSSKRGKAKLKNMAGGSEREIATHQKGHHCG